MKITCEKLTKSYSLGRAPGIRVLDDLSAVFESGKITAIVGVSGSGKSTLLDLISLVTTPDSGRILFDGRDISARSRRELAAFRRDNIGYLPQELGLIPILTAEENIRLPHLISGREDDVHLLQKRDDRLGVADCLAKLPHELSGGQCQRIAMLRALANKPRVFIADEPTSRLDSENIDRFLALVADLRASGTTVVLATHDARVAECADVRMNMDGGRGLLVT